MLGRLTERGELLRILHAVLGLRIVLTRRSLYRERKSLVRFASSGSRNAVGCWSIRLTRVYSPIATFQGLETFREKTDFGRLKFFKPGGETRARRKLGFVFLALIRGIFKSHTQSMMREETGGAGNL
jgi:hypothetical protein